MIRFRRDIEGLRAIAVSLVILDHLAIRGFDGGFIGVDVFFVISGYLITSLLAAEYAEKAANKGGLGSISILYFYLRRARRILPAAMAVIVVVVVASHWSFNSLRVHQVQRDALWAALFGSNVNFIRQATDYFAAGLATSSPFSHYWSLAVEEQFYFVWPALFLIVTGRHGLTIWKRRISWRPRLAVTLIAVGIASFVWSVRDTATNPASAYFSTFTRVWELALGALIGVATTRATTIGSRQATAFSLAGVGLLLAGCIVIDANSAFPGYIALLPTLGAALLIIAGIPDTPPLPNRVLALAPMRFIGRISYSLYLWHWPLIVFAGILYPHASARLGTRLVILASSLAIATVSFYVIERPFRRMSFGGRSDRPDWLLNAFDSPALRRTFATAAGFALAGVAVGTVIFALRYQDRQQQQQVGLGAANVAAIAPQVPAVATSPIRRASGGASYDKLLNRWQVKVKAALSLRSVPKPLRPLRSQLAPASSPCAGYRLAIVQHEQECSWGNPHARHVAAITGDSHAAMWIPTLEGALDPHTWLLHPFIRSWCGWSGNLLADVSNGRNKDCSTLQTQTLKQLQTLHVDLLILSQGTVPSTSTMARSLAAFAGVAKHVVVLGHTPFVVPNFIDCLKGDTDISKCKGVLSEEDFASVNLERSAAALFNDPFIDTTPWFCFGLICPPIIDNAPAFADGDHISTVIAPKLTPLLRESLRQAGAL